MARRFLVWGGTFDLAGKEKELSLLEKKMEDPSFWEDKQAAEKTVTRVSELKSWVAPLKKILSLYESLDVMYPEVESLGDADLLKDLEEELFAGETLLEELEIRRMFTKKEDSCGCFLSVNAGAGGTESCDWALMLSRMYLRYAERKGWKAEVMSELSGDVAGIKNTTIRIEGDFAYGYLRAETGVHRLVRISPFDSNAKRHTSFASIEVVPILADDIEVDVKTEDIRVDTFRASGAGGQHVNTTDSAVRMTHAPTGIVVSCQQERSQIKNRETCLKMLKAKIYQKMLEEKKQELSGMAGEKKDIAWGSQIRNYVLHPYTLVKDPRTKHEVGDTKKVLDGDIDPFIYAYLKMRGGDEV
ncbi:MAG: Peptide chain release factor 2 [Chlamydiia bacterium]|nr:Peptide chain release factor 2 [Chlamydiia bacterium]MCH9618395.1 Peptide chain release factor 2 [Chlamydiia bacterium]MCH9624287.1 Peptide chain release factor 2 [Chlamydiia bacterium]